MAANNATIVEEIETFDERDRFRALFIDYKVNKKRARPPRSRSRPRPSVFIDNARQINAPSSSSTAPSKDAKVANKYKSYVKVATRDLERLDETFARALESQDKTSAYLSFLSRQIEAERQVFTEARTVLQELISELPNAREAT